MCCFGVFPFLCFLFLVITEVFIGSCVCVIFFLVCVFGNNTHLSKQPQEVRSSWEYPEKNADDHFEQLLYTCCLEKHTNDCQEKKNILTRR